MIAKGSSRQSRVPENRFGRLFHLGVMIGELALGGLKEGARMLVHGRPLDRRSLFLSSTNARRLAQRLSRLRGAAMKLGQLLSLEGDDLLPAEFAEALAVLRASADSMPLTQLKRVLGREYGKGWESRFASFEFEPLAAASIGQVHRARTRDGRDLALKVQYPGVARSVASDVDNVLALLRPFKLFPVDFDVASLATEAKQQLRQEADYLAEARFLSRYRALVADEPAVQVPRVHADLTTRHIIAMDFLEGIRLDEWLRTGASQTRRDAVGELIEKLLFRELFELRFMQTDPNPANYLYDPVECRLALLDFGSVCEFSPEIVARYARISRATMDKDRAEVRRAAVDLGYLASDDSDGYAEAVVDLIMLVCEPLRHRGRYDFPGSNLAARARALGFNIGMQHGYLRPPAPETLFLHRKLVGSFLLCARLGARVDVRALIRPYVQAIGEHSVRHGE